MRKKIIFLLITCFTLSNSSAYALILPVETKNYWRAQSYIANQINGIGLVDSYQEDNTDQSYVYDNVLSAMASMSMGNFGVASEILDTLAFEVQRTPENVLYESYNYYNYNGSGNGTAYAGNSAWLLQALNIYQKLRGSKTYYALQKQLADFLLTLQDPADGGIRGSTYEYWKSTEHNLMAYAALRNFGRLNSLPNYVTQAEKVKTFLLSQAVWNGTYFNRGAWDTKKVVDVQSLAVLLFGPTYAKVLNWAELNLKNTKGFYWSAVTGFDFNDDLDTVWIEGTLQAALAFYRTGNTTKSNYYYNEALKTVQADGSLVLATNIGSASESWTLQPWHSIAPTAWLILYYFKFNPLILY
ncbi:MAG: hypothetical protein PHN57_00895 [Candidatus Omnitrophica bacterium]|nr:hypothetical protein [Candidatus Omnitrophota bacterium]